MMINSHYVWLPDKENVIKKVGNGHFNAVAIWQIKNPPDGGLLLG